MIYYIPVSHDMMRQTNDCSPVRVMKHKVMYFLYLSQKILVKINLPGQKSHPSEQVTMPSLQADGWFLAQNINPDSKIITWYPGFNLT